jgi:hypothetical protein
VVVDAGTHWLFHAGDAFYHPGTIDGSSRGPISLRLQEAAFAFDNQQLRQGQRQISNLDEVYEGKTVRLINAHSPKLYDRARQEERLWQGE